MYEDGKRRLREQLQEGATVHAKRDQQLAKEWFELEDESWK
ncbi:MAG: hypothetical protein O3C23_01725 [bacterium]|nr:hypothetical protein [bacterium]